MHQLSTGWILFGRAANTEKEEAFSTGIKTNTRVTSNYDPDNLVIAIVCAQARKSFSSSGKLL